jgi:hypothetical protein
MPPYSGNNASLALQVNRLSGGIPAQLVNAPNIQLLSGNLFSCDANRNDLPVHDPS